MKNAPRQNKKVLLETYVLTFFYSREVQREQWHLMRFWLLYPRQFLHRYLRRGHMSCSQSCTWKVPFFIRFSWILKHICSFPIFSNSYIFATFDVNPQQNLGPNKIHTSSFVHIVSTQIGTSTNVGHRTLQRSTVQTSDLQTSDLYKRQTGTNVGQRQTSDRDKRRTEKRQNGTNVGPVQTSDSYIFKEKRRTLVTFEKRLLL